MKNIAVQIAEMKNIFCLLEGSCKFVEATNHYNIPFYGEHFTFNLPKDKVGGFGETHRKDDSSLSHPSGYLFTYKTATK